MAAGRTVTLTGVASDDLTIRGVRWYDKRGQGVARLTWRFAGNKHEGWQGDTLPSRVLTRPDLRRRHQPRELHESDEESGGREKDPRWEPRYSSRPVVPFVVPF